MKHKENGFGVLGVIAIVLVVAVLALAGWYVWHKSKEEKLAKKPTTSESESKKPPKPDTLPAADTRDWVTYSNAEGDFSFKHPKTWVFASNPELCSEGLVLFAASTAALGKCATESFGQMSVGSQAGDLRSEYTMSAGYTDTSISDVTIHGVTGKKQVGTAEGQEDGEGIPGYPDGTVVTRYIFYTGGRTLTATYVQLAGYPDSLVDFNTLVTSTLKFTE